MTPMITLVKMIMRECLNAWRQMIIRSKMRSTGVVVAPTAILDFKNLSYRFGSKTTIGAFSYLLCENDPHESKYDGMLRVGNNVYFGQYNNIRASGGPIVIGDNCLISQFVSIIASGHQTSASLTINRQPPTRDAVGVTIGNDVWLGAGSIILPGVQIGDGAVVGAGAVVTENVPANAIYVGVPAKFLRSRS